MHWSWNRTDSQSKNCIHIYFSSSIHLIDLEVCSAIRTNKIINTHLRTQRLSFCIFYLNGLFSLQQRMNELFLWLYLRSQKDSLYGSTFCSIVARFVERARKGNFVFIFPFLFSIPGGSIESQHHSFIFEANKKHSLFNSISYVHLKM